MRNSKVLSYISVVLLAIFIFLALGSPLVEQLRETFTSLIVGLERIYLTNPSLLAKILYLPGWAMEAAYHDQTTDASQTRTGTNDSHGRHHGETQTTLGSNTNGSVEKITNTGDYKVIGNYEHGRRHGWHDYFNPDGSLYDRFYYQHGHRTAEPGQAKPIMNYSVSQSNVLSYNILQHENPWFMFKMMAYGIDGSRIESFMSALQSRMVFYAPWDDTDFTNAFRDAVEDIYENDTLMVQHYEFIAAVEGLTNMKNFDLRLAIIDRYLGAGETTFQILHDSYTDFLEGLPALVDGDMLKSFSDDLDSLMDIEGSIDLDDPAYIEYIEERLILALAEMFEENLHFTMLLILQNIVTDLAFQANPIHEAMRAAYFGVSVDDEYNRELLSPYTFTLEQNYPNPFNPATNIRFSIAEQTQVQLIVYDTVGKEVAILVDKVKNPGNYVELFDASNLSSGVYLYQLRTGDHVETKRLVLVK
jgi:hypothetical protein